MSQRYSHRAASYRGEHDPQTAEQAGRDLAERVVREVVPLLAQGLIAALRHADGAAAELSQERLDAIYQATLALLYRILFLLYAQARGLLSRPDRAASDLRLLLTEVAGAAGSRPMEAPGQLGVAFSAFPGATRLYARLLDLMSALAHGEPALDSLFGLAPQRQDGGAAQSARFLRRYRLPDYYLARALHGLACRPDARGAAFVPVDYACLDTRYLGAIHERLLQMRLRLAPVPPASAGAEAGVAVARAPTRRAGRGPIQWCTGAGERVVLERDRHSRKATGCYYTPAPIVRSVVERAVGPVLHEHLERLRPLLHDAAAAGERPHELTERFFAVRVLDPAMGSGYFLVEAVTFIAAEMLRYLHDLPPHLAQRILPRLRATALAELERAGMAADGALLTDLALLKRLVLAHCIYGIDLSPPAVELARASLWLTCAVPGLPLPRLDQHVRAGDALLGAWELEFAQVSGGLRTARREQGFDIVIGNPPWASYSGRQRVPLRREVAALYAARFRSAHGWLSAQGLFLERAQELLREGGRLGLVVPAQLCDLDGFRPVREVLAAQGEVQEPCPYHGEDAFQGVTGPAITVHFRRGTPRPQQAARWLVADAPPVARAHSKTASDEPGLECLFARLQQMEPFGPRAFGDSGVHTGNCRRELIVCEGGPGRAPIREGRDLLPFVLLSPRLFVRLDLQAGEGRYFRLQPLHHYTSCPIVLRQTAHRPIAALHDEATYFRNSVLACYGLDGLPHAATVALLNSELLAWFHRRAHRDARQRSFPQVKIGHLRALPRPPLQDDAAQARLLRLARCAEWMAQPSAENRHAAINNVCNDLVYRLYGVTPAESSAIKAELGINS